MNFVSFSHVLKDSVFCLPPFKRVKAIFNSQAVQNQEMGRTGPTALVCWPQLLLGQGARSVQEGPDLLRNEVRSSQMASVDRPVDSKNFPAL